MVGGLRVERVIWVEKNTNVGYMGARKCETKMDTGIKVTQGGSTLCWTCGDT